MAFVGPLVREAGKVVLGELLKEAADWVVDGLKEMAGLKESEAKETDAIKDKESEAKGETKDPDSTRTRTR